MGKNDRRGAIKPRELRLRRTPDLGYYLIITDTKETEKNYFEGIKRKIPSDLCDRIIIKIEKTSTVGLVRKALELRNEEPQYRMPWIVFDRDQVIDFDKIIKDAQDSGVGIGWSNPCLEIWLYAYFGSMPVINDSVRCCSEFEKIYLKNTRLPYSKSDKYVYEKLCRFGDENRALEIAKSKHLQCIRDGKTIPSEMVPCTTVYELISEINEKLVGEG